MTTATLLAGIGLWIVATSAVTFVAFALDKRAAAAGRRRTAERTLHMLEFIGGWPGAFAAMTVLRHKNRKVSYWALTAAIALLHAAGALAAFRLNWSSQ